MLVCCCDCGVCVTFGARTISLYTICCGCCFTDTLCLDDSLVSPRTLNFLLILLFLPPLTPELDITSVFNGVSGGVESSIDSPELIESLSDLRIIGIPSLCT